MMITSTACLDSFKTDWAAVNKTANFLCRLSVTPVVLLNCKKEISTTSLDFKLLINLRKLCYWAFCTNCSRIFNFRASCCPLSSSEKPDVRNYVWIRSSSKPLTKEWVEFVELCVYNFRSMFNTNCLIASLVPFCWSTVSWALSGRTSVAPAFTKFNSYKN